MSKKIKSYNLSKEVIQAISNKSKEDNRKDSDWLNIFLTNELVLNAKENPTVVNIATVEKPKEIVKRFVPPIVEEVFNYCNERCNNVNAQEFVDHYSANGWMRGKTKVKDWKACVRTWEKNNKPTQNKILTDNLTGQW